MGYKTESNKWTHKNKHRYRQQNGGYQREGGGEDIKRKGRQIYNDGRFTLCDWHTMQYTDDGS